MGFLVPLPPTFDLFPKNFPPEVMLKHTEPARELSFAEKNPRHLVHSPEKIVKAISDHVRLAYGKNKRSSSMGIRVLSRFFD